MKNGQSLLQERQAFVLLVSPPFIEKNAPK
jgi:hypothetical protein